MDSVDVVVPSPALAPTLLPVRLLDWLPSTVTAPSIVPTADRTANGTVDAMELFQSIGWDASVKHNVVPDLLRPLGRLQTRGVD